jgi:tetratricopeptide (TPR) repeat protein
VTLTRRRIRLATLFVAGVFVSPLYADGVAGPYLAAQAASQRSDYAAAADYFTQALVHDPSNTGLMEVAALSDVALGDFAAALPLAKSMIADGGTNQTANIVILTDQLKRGAFDEAVAGIAAGNGLGPLVDGLVGAWALVGEGKMSDALAAFDKLGTSPGLEAFALYHKALAMASVGDFEGAEKIFSGNGGTVLNLSRRGVIADAEVLSQLDRNPDALTLLNTSFGPESDPVIDALRQRLKDGQTLPFDMVRNAGDGLSEVFFSVAAALKGEAAASFSLVYARTAEELRPDNADAILLTGDLLESQGQHDLAIAAYGKVTRDDPAYYNAQLGRAQALYASGQIDAGIDAMKQVATAHPELIAAQTGLGDLLRRQERYGEAATAYDAAVALIQTPRPDDWSLFYVRGICNERQGQWDKAEPDFRKALALKPDQPEVLNYLGYALVERNEKLPEALEMIKRAVVARPDDGYIVDSLSWAYFRTGDYAKALPVAEHASQLMPVDAVVTDHLGDVYWAVGRKLEAEFQWHRALSYDPDPKDATRIRRKLAIGLDGVLKEEGAAPLKVLVDNGSSGG